MSARPSGSIDPAGLARQEERFADAFAAGKIELARALYHPAVEYHSPTVRLFDERSPICGVDATLVFIQRTIERCRDIAYRAVEQACLPDGDSAFARIHFDWSEPGGRRLRSNYVVLYRYRDRRIARQELYYDPSGRLEDLSPAR